MIEFVLATAFTGFSAARLESARLNPSPVVAIHTGFWGCGAFGGNRVLMRSGAGTWARGRSCPL
jgi:hypothetical protein